MGHESQILSEERIAQWRWTDHILPDQMKRELRTWWGKEKGRSDGEPERWTMGVECVFEWIVHESRDGRRKKKRERMGWMRRLGQEILNCRTAWTASTNECGKKVTRTGRGDRDKLVKINPSLRRVERRCFLTEPEGCSHRPTPLLSANTHTPLRNHYRSPATSAVLWKRKDYSWKLRKHSELFFLSNVFLPSPFTSCASFCRVFWASNKIKPRNLTCLTSGGHN